MANVVQLGPKENFRGGVEAGFAHSPNRLPNDQIVEQKIKNLVEKEDPTAVKKEGKFTLTQACALNTLNMFGTGPFITVPFVVAVAAPPGPHAMYGYGLACIACVLDSLVWAELGSIWPKNGGTYIYLREMFNPNTWGRPMAFLFVWQFLISGPMEVASGFIAMAQYLSYITNDTSFFHHSGFAFLFCLFSIFLLYRKIDDVGKLTIVFWVGTIGAIFFCLIVGFANFNAEHFVEPADAWTNKGRTLWSLGLVARFGVYDFTGYFDINQIGDEVKDPKTTIPIACIFTCCYVCVFYVLVNISILGYLPWDPAQGGFVDLVTSNSDSANYIMAIFAEKFLGREFACFFAIVVIFTIFGSCFAIMLGYSMIPSAAARDGYFYSWFAHEHEEHEGLADYALMYVGFWSLIFCFVPLGVVIEGMITTRVLVQFMAQSAGLMWYRHTHPDTERVFKMPYHKTLCTIHLIIFAFIFLTTDNWIVSGGTPLMEMAVLYLVAGGFAYLMWAHVKKQWPYNVNSEENAAVTLKATGSHQLVVPPTASPNPKQDQCSTPTPLTPQ